MIPITQSEQDILTCRLAGALSHFQPGEDAIAVLSRIYQENLPDKSPRQAAAMAREAVAWVQRFQESMEAAPASPEEQLRCRLQEELAPLSPEDQCKTLQRILHPEQSPVGIPAGQDATRYRDALMTEAVSQLSAPVLLPEPEAEGMDCRQRVKLACGDNTILAATAMVLYAMAKKGELAGIPQNITLGQAVLCVCANDTQCQILWSRANGFLSGAKAHSRLETLAATFKTLWIFALFPTVSAVFLTGGALAITAGGIAALAGMGFLATLAFRKLDAMIAGSEDGVAEIPLNIHISQKAQPEDARKAAPVSEPILPTLPPQEETETDDEDLLFF